MASYPPSPRCQPYFRPRPRPSWPSRRCSRRILSQAGSGAHEDLECLAGVHQAVALGDVFQRDGAVEDASGVDLPVQDARHELFHVGAGGRDAAGQGEVAHEFREGEGDFWVLRCADAANRAAIADDSDALDQRVLQAHAFQYALGAGPAGQFPDRVDAVLAAAGDHVGGAELTAQFGALGAMVLLDMTAPRLGESPAAPERLKLYVGTEQEPPAVRTNGFFNRTGGEGKRPVRVIVRESGA